MNSAPTPLAVYQILFTSHGPQAWWPGASPFQIMVGAVLTQNTAWRNVEQAIANLIRHRALSPETILAARQEDLAEWLRPCGYFNVKARRLVNFCRWYLKEGGFTVLAGWETATLRMNLLAVNGIGPETADDILLYAFERPVFVVDAYTRRLFSRLGLVPDTIAYEDLRSFFEITLEPDQALFNEYHALIVRHGKEICRPQPLCDRCCLAAVCTFNELAVSLRTGPASEG